MKNKLVIWFGLALALSVLMAACGGTTTSTPESKALAVTATEQPVAAEEETTPMVSVNLNSSVHSSDLGGYAWIQEFLSGNDIDAADAQSWSESARAGAVCYASIAPAIKSEPSAADGSFSIAFEAEPGSTFRIMCDPDETHPGAMGIDVFTVPAAGGTIDHATAGFFSPGLWTPELGITNEIAAKADGYANAEEMFQSAGTCRVFALPGESATIAVSDGDAYGFYMEAPDTAGRITILDNPSRAGAYVVVKEFEAGVSEAEIELDFTDTSGSGLTWLTATCPIKKGFSTDLVVVPNDLPAGESEEATGAEEIVSSLSPVTAPDGDQVGKSELERETNAAGIAADFTLPDGNGNMVSLAKELEKNEQVVVVFYFGYLCPPCMNQLKEINSDLAKYEEKGAQVLAVAIQGEIGAGISAKNSEAQFPILADSDGTVAEAFGVEDDGWSTPSVFAIDQSGHITWKQISHI